jgi:CRP-like cAMP-binding protein
LGIGAVGQLEKGEHTLVAMDDLGRFFRIECCFGKEPVDLHGRSAAETRALSPGEDIVCQGDRPDVAVFVLSGMLARYHTLPSGDRQYLAFRIRGDLPDVQGLLLSVLDHSLCAMDGRKSRLCRTITWLTCARNGRGSPLRSGA